MRVANAAARKGSVMPKLRANEELSPADRQREVALILAKGVVRWCRHAKAAGIIDAQESPSGHETGLELSRETRLSVVNGARGLTGETSTPRNDGDEP